MPHISRRGVAIEGAFEGHDRILAFAVPVRRPPGPRQADVRGDARHLGLSGGPEAISHKKLHVWIQSFGSCKTGLFRFSHTDGDWHATRSAGYLVVTFSFLLTLPVGFANLGGELMALLVSTNAVSVVVLVSSMILDSMLLLPDFYYLRREVEQRDFGAIPCHSKRAGCVASSHFWWHVGAFVAVAIQLIGREVVLARLKEGGVISR